MPDPLMLSISGCRGIVGTSLTPAVITGFAHAVGSFVSSSAHKAARTKAAKGAKGAKAAKPSTPSKSARRPIVVVGRDGRAGGDMVARLAIAGLQSAGCDVVDLGVAMTPTVGIITDELGAGGLVLTASHNPQQWNGLKPIVKLTPPGSFGTAASAPDKAAADAIIASYHARASSGSAGESARWDGLGTVTQAEELVGFHGAKLVELLKDLKLKKQIKAAGFHAVVDSVNSSGTTLVKLLMDVLGVKLTHLGDEPTGLFTHTPEPTRENLTDLCAKVKKHKAHVGFAQDPDADRLAIVDEKGRYIGEEYTIVLCTRALAALGMISKGDTLVVNLSTSRMIEDAASAAGARVVRAAVGEANVVAAMKQHASPFGGEGNGGVIWPAMTFIRDSLSGMALVLGLMAIEDRPLSEIVDELPAYSIIKRKVDLARREDSAPGLARLAKHFTSTLGKSAVDLQDGVRINLATERTWAHVRPSNTEPILRLIAESPTPAQATKLLDEAAAVVSGRGIAR